MSGGSGDPPVSGERVAQKFIECPRCSQQDGGCRSECSRRDVLKGVGAAGGGVAAALAQRNVIQPVRAADPDRSGVFAADGSDPDAVFPQSVSSGGPTESGVILWTRIAPGAYVEGTDLGVEVATDEAFEDVVRRGIVDADAITADHDYTVKVDLDGELDSNTFYHYRFTYDGTRSRVGRCRTLPGPGESPDEISFGVVTCQDYQNGYYPAFHHLAEEDVDFLVHLGDFIYESANGAYTLPGKPVVRDLDLPSGSGLAESLADYRHLYNTYKSDRFLQEALESHTLIAGWDDHEVANDRYWDYDADAPGLPPHADQGKSVEFQTRLTADAIQAWVEQIPARVEYDPSEDDLHEQFKLWRTFEMGDLIDLAVTDERLFRSQPPCDDFTPICDGNADPDSTMLGSDQKDWFVDWATGSDAHWRVWVNEVMSMPLTLGEGDDQVEFVHESWDGFVHERREIMEALAAADVENFLTLTGDLHAATAGYQQTHYPGDESVDQEDRVGVEFMTPAVTSINAASIVDLPGGLEDYLLSGLLKLTNDHLEFADWHHHGYSVVEVGREETTYTAYAVDKGADDPDADRTVLTRLAVPSGEVKLSETPDAAFETNAREVAAGESVAFDASASSKVRGSISEYEWTFGDERTATGETVEHAYDAPGEYTVTLRVTDEEGNVDTAATTVTVHEAGCGTVRTTTETGDLAAGEAATYAYELRTEDPCGVTVSLSGPPRSDFDLYVTLDGRRPSPTEYDERSWTEGPNERVEIDGRELSSGGEIGVLVDGYQGTGEYELTVEERGR